MSDMDDTDNNPTEGKSAGSKKILLDRRELLGNAVVAGALALAGAPVVAGLAGTPAKAAAGAEKPLSGMTGLGPEWTGPGGIGDYAKANGNTYDVVNTGHKMVRNRDFSQALASASDAGEDYDVIIVGGGIAGLCTAYTLQKERPGCRVLILEMSQALGGEAKPNEFEVDGTHLWAPQGSNVCGVIDWNSNTFIPFHELYNELDLPTEFKHQRATGTTNDIRFPTDNWAPQLPYSQVDIGYYYPSAGWIKNPWSNGFRDAPIPENVKLDLMTIQAYQRLPYREDWRTWLDSMSYKDFLTKEVGVSTEAAEFYDHILAAFGLGLGTDVISAYPIAQRAYLLHEQKPLVGFMPATFEGGNAVSLPGGNATLARRLLQKVIPDAFSDAKTLGQLYKARLHTDKFDRVGQPVRLRTSSMVVSVSHDGSPEAANGVVVIYDHDDKLHKVRGRATVLCSQQHTNKKICSDITTPYREAMGEFHHAPMLIVNVAVRNWRFLDKLGISYARWFDGFGWYMGLHRQILIDGEEWMPLHPDKPAVFTMINSFVDHRGAPLAEQAAQARHELFAMSYADIESRVVEQFTKMFGPYGFDAKRDIAGIIANKWGHAYHIPQVGFYFGKGGKPRAADILRKRFGRICFAHSELKGEQLWPHAVEEAIRAAKQVLEVI